MIHVLDSVADALNTGSTQVTSTGSIGQLGSVATHAVATALGGSAVLWLLDDAGSFSGCRERGSGPALNCVLARGLARARPSSALGLLGRVVSTGAQLRCRKRRGKRSASGRPRDAGPVRGLRPGGLVHRPGPCTIQVLGRCSSAVRPSEVWCLRPSGRFSKMSPIRSASPRRMTRKFRLASSPSGWCSTPPAARLLLRARVGRHHRHGTRRGAAVRQPGLPRSVR